MISPSIGLKSSSYSAQVFLEDRRSAYRTGFSIGITLMAGIMNLVYALFEIENSVTFYFRLSTAVVFLLASFLFFYMERRLLERTIAFAEGLKKDSNDSN